VAHSGPRRSAAAIALAGSVAWAAVAEGDVRRPEPVRETRRQQPAAAPPIDSTIARHRTASRPGTEHRWLEPLAGSWALEATWRTAGREPVRATGTSENRFILDGRFLLCESSSGEGESRIEAMTFHGFDGRRKQFFAVVLDNLRTYSLQLWGNYDPTARSFVLSGKERDEVSGAALVYRLLLRIESPERHTVELFVDVPGGTPVKVLDAVYTRR
jgi:hypothetical protein